MSTSQIEKYFNFITSDDIRLKNTRIGIETILFEYLDRGLTPEEIAQIYPSLSLEQVYATILYYLQNRQQISNYLKNWREHGNKKREEQRLNPPPVSLKLKQLRRERKTMQKNK